MNVYIAYPKIHVQDRSLHIGEKDLYGDFKSWCECLVIPAYVDEYMERNFLRGSIKPLIENRARFDVQAVSYREYHNNRKLKKDISKYTLHSKCRDCERILETIIKMEEMHS